MVTSPRCEHCVSLTLYDIRVEIRHHLSLSDLKYCAESGTCDICLLLWAALLRECSLNDIDECLRGRPSDPKEGGDTAVQLKAEIFDRSRLLRAPQLDSTSGDRVRVRVRDAGSGVYAELCLFARPSKWKRTRWEHGPSKRRLLTPSRLAVSTDSCFRYFRRQVLTRKKLV